MNIRYETMTSKLPSWMFAHKILIIHVCTFLTLRCCSNLLYSFLKNRLFLFSVYEVYLYACMYVSNMYAKYLWRLEVSIGSAGMGVSDACDQHNGC